MNAIDHNKDCYHELVHRLSTILPGLQDVKPETEDFEFVWGRINAEISSHLAVSRLAKIQAARLEQLDGEVEKVQRILQDVASDLQDPATPSISPDAITSSPTNDPVEPHISLAAWQLPSARPSSAKPTHPSPNTTAPQPQATHPSNSTHKTNQTLHHSRSSSTPAARSQASNKDGSGFQSPPSSNCSVNGSTSQARPVHHQNSTSTKQTGRLKPRPERSNSTGRSIPGTRAPNAAVQQPMLGSQPLLSSYYTAMQRACGKAGTYGQSQALADTEKLFATMAAGYLPVAEGQSTQPVRSPGKSGLASTVPVGHIGGGGLSGILLGDDAQFKAAEKAFKTRQRSPEHRQERWVRNLLETFKVPTLAQDHAVMVDEAVEKLMGDFAANAVLLPLHRVGPFTYNAGGKQIKIKLLNGNLVVRVGGGYEALLSYLSKVPKPLGLVEGDLQGGFMEQNNLMTMSVMPTSALA